jgi:hypothetical protein
VNYGALRSLVESSVHDPSVGAEVFTKLTDRVELLMGRPDLLRALERFLVLSPRPTSWTKTISPLIEELWSNALTEEDQDRWKELADQVARVNRRASAS